MPDSIRGTKRGRGACLGLALLLGGCGGPAPGPVADAIDGYTAPSVQVVDGVPLIRNEGPAERLHVYEELPERGLTLLFLQGRSATPMKGGGSAWADMDGGRVVLFDRDGVVAQVLGGRPVEGPPLARPAFVAFDRGAVLAVEIDGSALRFADGAPQGWVDDAARGARVGGADRLTAAVRTVFDIRLVPLGPQDPLLWIDDGRGDPRPAGRIRMPEQALLAPLVNSGWVAPTADRSVVFASAVRSELHRYAEDGTAEWFATWSREGVSEPTFGVSQGTLVPRFRLIHQAVAEGPDGRIYTLVTRGEDGPADRLLVIEPDGTLLREADVDPWAAIYVAASGHVYVADAADALARTEAIASPRRFDSFALPTLGGGPEIRLEDHRGKVVVVNFWASWCRPCRQEMPLLDELTHVLDADQAVVIGLNEDVRPADAVRFVDEELGGVHYALAEGGGRLRARYGYRGLPYTVVLDREGRIARAFYGFGDSIEPIRRALDEALARAP